jgi:uncharacterized membrane protein
MLEFLSWLESSALGEGIRASGVWTYGLLNLGHIFGISTLFGSVLLLDLRLLGCWRNVPLATIARIAIPVAVIGFALAVVSGVCMLTVNGSEYYGNPFLLIKFSAIGLGLINLVVVSFLPEWRTRARREPDARERLRLAVAGGVSLATWGTALAAGRMIGYW